MNNLKKIIFAVILSSVVLIGCDAFRSKSDLLIGTWYYNTIIHGKNASGYSAFYDDGTAYDDFVLGYSRFQIEYTWKIENNLLTISITKSNSDGLPKNLSTSDKILSLTDKTMVLESENTEITYNKVGSSPFAEEKLKGIVDSLLNNSK